MPRSASNRTLLGAFFLLVVLLIAHAASAQSPPDIENGLKAYGSYDGTKLDTVNVMNGNLMLHIPMPFSYPQRGGRIEPKNLLTISSKQWSVQCVAPPQGGSVCSWVYGGGPGQTNTPVAFGLGFDYSLDFALYRSTVTTSGSGVVTYSGYDYVVASADMAIHQLVASPNAVLDGNGDPTSFDAVDTSGLHVDLIAPDPVSGIPTQAVIADRKGNRYQTGKITGTCRSTTGMGGSTQKLQ